MSNQASTQTAEIVKLDADQLKQRKYFKPADLASGVAHLEHVMGSVDGTPLHFNFDPENFTAKPGFGLLIIPQTKKMGKGIERKLESIIAAFVPDIQTVVANPKGADLIGRIWEEAASRRLKGMLSAAVEEGSKVVFPEDEEGFFERASRGEGLEAFNHKEIAAKYVSGFKKQGLETMDKNMLRAILMSESYAKQQFPRITQSQWIAVARKMQSDATKLGLNATIYDTWLENRATKSFSDVDTLDLSAFGIGAEQEAAE